MLDINSTLEFAPAVNGNPAEDPNDMDTVLTKFREYCDPHKTFYIF